MKIAKRIVISILLVVLIGITIYKVFEKKTAPIITIGTFNMIELTEVSLKGYNKREDGDYFVFIMANNADSQYVLEYVIAPLTDDLKKHPFPSFEVIKLTDSEISLSALKKKWEINGFPTFLKITVKDQIAEITSKLEWTTETPYDSDDLKKWLDLNDLWPEVVSYRY